MKIILTIFIVFFTLFSGAQNTVADFVWSNSNYYNMNVGDSIRFNDTVVRLLAIDKQFTQLKVGVDTLNLRVARRSLPVSAGGVQLFVADNRNVAELTPNDPAHSLLTGDALVCIIGISEKWLATDDFMFPVSFNHGFMWTGDEDSYIFSLTKDENRQTFYSYPGIGIDMNDARGLEKHWLLAMEESKVEWVEESDKNTACVCLSSNTNSGIYYIYDKLYTKTLDVRKGQKLEPGDLIGTAWGDEKWGYVLLAVVYSDSVPDYENRFSNCVNFFPQLFGLYYRESFAVSNYYTKGRIVFGRPAGENNHSANASAGEVFLGKGWKSCSWNTAEKLEWISKETEGNVRLLKTLFAGTTAEVSNPNNFCEYEINVRNGVYRIRARVGDVEKASWQKIEFEGISAGTFTLEPGIQKWTPEKVVKVEDTKLTVRVYFEEGKNTIAGLSELVFQQAY